MKTLSFLVILSIAISATSAINWQPGDWAMDCDFFGNDLSNRLVRGDLCSSTCQATSGCTHFTWTLHNNGTCWMKRGSVTKANAVYLQGAVCGIVSPGANGLNRGRLLWSDEFDYAGPPSPFNWVQSNHAASTNNELQFYTLDRNSQVGGGNLVITSRREDFGGKLI